MKKLTFTLLLIGAIAFCSCGDKVLLDETRTFDRETWLRFQPEQYELTPQSTDDCYNFIITATIDTSRFREAGLPIMLEIDNSNHENRTLFATLLLRNHNGNWMGTVDENGNLVVTQMVRQFFFFSSTTPHTIKLGQRTSKYEIHGIRSINFKVEKAKVVYPE
ncbi:MAG: hypothetical protein IJK84_07635 [Bacteroidales bacterium]|nr:hypothetical protein [Bacteroidales bacterium]